MKIIKEINIENFRSCKNFKIKDLENFSVLSGRNNAGKSNALRALNLFFTDAVEPNIPLNILRDCSAAKKKKKEIRIEIVFALPPNVRIQKNLPTVSKLIKKGSRIQKVYQYDPSLNSGYKILYFLDGKILNDQLYTQAVEQFINLFNFRYITADRTAKSVLEENLIELEAELNYRMNIKSKVDGQKEAETESLKVINQIAQDLFNPIAVEITRADGRIKNVNISTPQKVTELIKSSKYQFVSNNDEIYSEALQGSGIQSLLLFSVLALVDGNFHRKFGWKIATIWAIEEPEIFLHYDLEIQLASYLYSLCETDKQRFQIICTTHSTTISQFANAHFLIQKDSNLSDNSTIVNRYEPHIFNKQLKEEKITNAIHLLTMYQNKKIVLVEGHIDEFHVKKLIELNNLNNFVVFSISRFVDQEDLKGESFLVKFLEGNIDILEHRQKNAGIIAIFDWEVEKGKLDFLTKRIKSPNIIYQFKQAQVNSLLDKTFRGIERFYDTAIIKGVLSKHKDLIFDRGTNYQKDRYRAEDGKKYKLVKHELYQESQNNIMKYTYFADLLSVLKKA